MARRDQAGFTLIELIIVMAISSLLGAAVLSGFSVLRSQAQFSDAIERLKETVLIKRTEALSTIKLSGGDDAANITFGRLLTFTPGSSSVTVQTLYTANNEAPAANQPVYTLPSEDGDTTIAWGVRYSDASTRQVAFVRSSVDGALQTAVSPPGGWAGPTYRYGDFAPNGAAANLNFTDSFGRQAYLTIDPAKNSVTRTYP
jgi:prepilin-type N-terminal cleavage/methylation domain-containing protein